MARGASDQENQATRREASSETLQRRGSAAEEAPYVRGQPVVRSDAIALCSSLPVCLYRLRQVSKDLHKGRANQGGRAAEHVQEFPKCQARHPSHRRVRATLWSVEGLAELAQGAKEAWASWE